MSERTKRDGVVPAGTGKWRISVNAGRDPETGKYLRVRETFTGTRAEAKARRAKLLVAANGGTVSASRRENVREFVERWIQHRQHIGKVRETRAYSYRGHLRRIVYPRIGSMQLTRVRPTHVQQVLDAALDDGCSSGTVLQVHRILHAAFRQGVRWQDIPSNPSDGVEPPKIEAASLIVPTADQLRAIFGEIDAYFRAPLAVAAMTGLRRSEVLALRWSDVGHTLSVGGGLHRVKARGLIVLPPKSDRSRRSVPIPPTLAATLRVQRQEQDERRELAGEAWADGDFVFDRGDGQPVDPGAFGRAYRAARDAAGVLGVRLHDLRHAFATMQVAEGTDLKLVSDLLGHATVAFTLQTYVHPDEQAAAAAAETTERLLGRAVGLA